MKALAVALAAVALLALAGGAFAAPALTAPDTGLIDIPTADLTPSMSVALAADWQDLSGDASVIPVRAVVGLAGRAELGAAWNRVDLGDDNEDLIGFAGKMVLLPETDVVPAVAVGVRYGKLDLGEPPLVGAPLARAIALDFGEVTSITAYGVVTKQLSVATDTDYGFALTGHAGIAWHRVKVENLGSETDNQFEGFVGAEWRNPRGIAIAAEYRTEPAMSDDPISSIMVRYPLSPKLAVHAGWTNAVPGLSVADDDHNLFAGVTYNFGFGY